MSGELGFEDRVKIFGPVDPSQTVAVSEGSEYSNFVGVFESYAGGHFDVGFVFCTVGRIDGREHYLCTVPMSYFERTLILDLRWCLMGGFCQRGPAVSILLPHPVLCMLDST